MEGISTSVYLIFTMVCVLITQQRAYNGNVVSSFSDGKHLVFSAPPLAADFLSSSYQIRDNLENCMCPINLWVAKRPLGARGKTGCV